MTREDLYQDVIDRMAAGERPMSEQWVVENDIDADDLLAVARMVEDAMRVSRELMRLDPQSWGGMLGGDLARHPSHDGGETE